MGEFVSKNGTGGLYLGSGSPVAYTKIPGVKSFDIGSVSAEQLDVTDYDSPAGWREFANGLRSASNGSFVMNYDPGETTQEALRTAEGGAAQKFKALFDDKQVTFTALVIGFSTPQQVGAVAEATVTIQLTGAPTWANAT